jgi:SAM-dependent methyltransferase
MKETSKAMRRRAQEVFVNDEGFQWSDIFKGRGIDVGSGDDPLTPAAGQKIWTRMIKRARICRGGMQFTCQHLDLPEGGGDDLTQFVGSNEQFDFVHGSQVLEHAIDPAVMLRSWLKVLKPGGYIVATVPDYELYEGCVWSSRWNTAHTSTWSLRIKQTPAEIHCKLPEWLHGEIGNPSRPEFELKLCRLVDTNYDYKVGTTIDQTFDPRQGVEAFIEFVIRKRGNEEETGLAYLKS